MDDPLNNCVYSDINLTGKEKNSCILIHMDRISKEQRSRNMRQTIDYYVDDAKKESQLRQLKVDKKGKATITMQPNGGVILTKTAPEISERATLVTPNMKLKTR